MIKTCKNCGGQFCETEYMFCRECRKLLKKQMIEDGYLSPGARFGYGDGRTNDQREDVYETKYGKDR